MERRGGEESAQREETTHSHQTNDAMREPAPRLPRHSGVKQSIDWLELFQEVEAGESCTVVAGRYRTGGRPVKVDTLRRRLKRWRAAKKAEDSEEVSEAEGRSTARGRCRMAFTDAEETELADSIKRGKHEGAMVDRRYLAQRALQFYGERHPRSLRSVSSFACSPQWLTRFKRRNQLNYSKHTVRQPKPPTAEQFEAKIEEVARFQLELEDAIDHYDPEYVVNADEAAAQYVPPAP